MASAEMIDECEIFINEIRQSPELWIKDTSNYGNRPANNDKKWIEISEKFGMPVESVKKKWGMLKIQFRRELRKQIAHRIANQNSTFPTITPWKYFLPMLFLKEQVNFMKPIAAAGNRHSKLDWEEKNSSCDQIMIELQALEDTYKGPVYDEVPSMPSLSRYSKISLNSDANDTETNYKITKASINRPEKSFSDLLENFQKEIINLEREKIEKSCFTNKDDDVLFLHSILPYFKALDSKRKFILRTKIQQLVCDFVTGAETNPSDHSYAFNMQYINNL